MNVLIPPLHANTVSPYNPLGRQPVGEEERDSQPTSFEPVEESAETARAENRTREDDTHREQALRGRQQPVSGDELAEPGERPEEPSAYERDRERQEQREIEQLAARDREVRAHERAHAAVGGQHTGAPQLTYVRGPDGVAYAVAGEVSVNLSSLAGNPEATLRKAEQIQQAALAPADPSSQDRLIAAKAARIAEQARLEIRQAEQQQSAEQAAASEQRQAERTEEQKREQAEREAAAEERRQQEAERQAQLLESRNRAIDLNRRLLDIGLGQESRSPGELLDQRV